MTEDEGRPTKASAPPSACRPPFTLIVGLGNPILGDDGVGWKAAEEVKRLLIADCRLMIEQSAVSRQQSAIEVDCLALGGLSLMERLVGYDRAIVIDAVQTHRPPGAVSVFRLEEFPDHSGANLTAAHDTSLQKALALGRQLGAHLPTEVWVVGIEAERLYDFSETLTPAVAAAVPRAAQQVVKLLSSTETPLAEKGGL
jgi:hydrogenase maturation protease